MVGLLDGWWAGAQAVVAGCRFPDGRLLGVDLKSRQQTSLG